MAAQQQSLMEKMCLHAVRRDKTSRITAHDVYVLPVDPFHHQVLRDLDRTDQRPQFPFSEGARLVGEESNQ
jgi:hypothetical protein